MKTRPSLFLVWALAAAAGCGSVSNTKTDAGGDGPAAGDFSLAVSTASISQLIAGDATFQVTITRGGLFTGDVMLSATGLPAGVTAAFAMNPVPGGTTSADVTLSVASTAAVGTSNITITGTSGTLSHSAMVSLELKTLTVAGKVRSGAAGVTVHLVGKPAVVSDSSGNFTYTDVIVPYDIYTIGVSGIFNQPDIPTVDYYKGLTRPDPVLDVAAKFTPFFFVSSSATVNGTRSGTGNATDPVVVIWSNGGSPDTALDGSSGYSVPASWSGLNTNNTGTLHGLQFTRAASGAPNGYLGYGTANATLAPNGTSTVNLAFANVSSAQLTGSITSPAGFPQPTLTLTQQFGNNAGVLWTGTTSTATAMIPVIAAGTSSLYATSTAGGATTQVVFPALATATDVTFALPAPAVATGPANNASGVTLTTPFAFQATPNTVYVVTMSNANATYNVYTAASTITIPNAAEVPLPAGASYSWSVTGYGPHAHLDEAADATALEGVAQADFAGPMHFTTSMPSRNFTTQ